MFSFISKYFSVSHLICSLIHWLVWSMLFNFHTIVNFPNFLLLLIFNIIPLRLENIFCIISILLNLLRLISWPNLWSVLENISYVLEKNVCYTVLGQVVLSMWLRSSWFIVFFIFCFLVELLCSFSIIRSSVLKSSVIIFDLFISVFSSVFVSCVLSL